MLEKVKAKNQIVKILEAWREDLQQSQLPYDATQIADQILEIPEITHFEVGRKAGIREAGEWLKSYATGLPRLQRGAARMLEGEMPEEVVASGEN